MNTPILFLVFHRPDVTVKVFEEIRKQKPQQLFIAGDGGRTPEEHEQCRATRETVLKMIDWKCDVQTLFRDKNLGCREAVSSAITWFFEHVEKGIILEEDCLPHPSFFPYCEELLERYKDDPRVMTVCGNNFQDGKKRGDGDYYFSYIMHCWGWASWRRAWKQYRKNMEGYKNFRENNRIDHFFRDKGVQNQFKIYFDSVFERRISSWAFVWTYSILFNDGLNILPSVNLISNVGCGEGATHMHNADHKLSKVKFQPIVLRKHPSKVEVDSVADLYTMRHYMGVRTPLQRVWAPIRQFLKFRPIMNPIESWVRKYIRRLPPKNR